MWLYPSVALPSLVNFPAMQPFSPKETNEKEEKPISAEDLEASGWGFADLLKGLSQRSQIKNPGERVPVTFEFSFIGAGMHGFHGLMVPEVLPLAEKKPQLAKETPQSSLTLLGVEGKKVLWGKMQFGAEEYYLALVQEKSPSGEVIALEFGQEGSQLFVNSNASRSFYDDHPPQWQLRFEYFEFRMAGYFWIHFDGQRSRMNAYHRPESEEDNILIYYRDYGLVFINHNRKTFSAMVLEHYPNHCDLNWPPSKNKKKHMRFFIERDGISGFSRIGEVFSVGDKFKLEEGNIAFQITKISKQIPGIYKVTLEMFHDADLQVKEVHRAPKIGERAPQIKMPLISMGGAPPKEFSLYLEDGTLQPNLAGKVILIEFWATWCTLCLSEWPDMRDAQDKFGSKLEVLGIHEKPRPEAAEIKTSKRAAKILQTIDQFKGGSWKHSVGWSDKIGNSYGVSSYPTFFLIDGDTGAILATKQLRSEGIIPTIERVLQEKE